MMFIFLQMIIAIIDQFAVRSFVLTFSVWLVGLVFSNSTMLSVSDKYEWVNEHTHTDQQQNKITYSRGVPEVTMN